MLNPDSPLAQLMAAPMRAGVVTWIGVRPARHAPLESRGSVTLDPAEGLGGDHYAGRSGNRQVSLIQAEHFSLIAGFLGLAVVTPAQLRRNIVVSGINLAALGGWRVRLGTAVIEPTGPCHPCSRMEAILGPGGYNAVRGHGGIVARIVAFGTVRVGDAIIRLEDASTGAGGSR